MNGKTAIAIILCLTAVAVASIFGVVVAIADGKEAPAALCTIIGTAVGGLAGALAQLVRKNGNGSGGH